MIKQNCQKPSREIQDEAVQKAEGTQCSNQIKQQTKLIVQGIQKGIDLYKKKQQKSSARCLNGKLKTVSSQHAWQVESDNQQMQEPPIYQRRWFSCLLLVLRLSWWSIVLAWVGIGIYLLI